MLTLASHHSATSFLNSLFLEWDEVTFKDSCFYLPLGKDVIQVPVEKYSKIGRHHYKGEFYLEGKKISFDELVHKVIQYLGDKFNTPAEDREIFTSRVFNSRDNIALIIKDRSSYLENLSIKTLTFKEAEQALFVGHTFHPTPKARSEFSEDEAKMYSPEHEGSFSLHWILVPEETYFEKRSEAFTADWNKEVFQTEFPHYEVPVGMMPFPVHPWQKKILLSHPDVKAIDLGEAKTLWSPTSSLRTLYRKESPYMLKFSVSVKLTNSVRNLLAKELDRGLNLHDVFQSESLKEFSQKNDHFELIHEPVFGGLKDHKGELIQESLFLIRFNPFQDNVKAIPLATLAMDQLNFGENLIHQCVRSIANESGMDLKQASLKWFEHFLKVAINPLIKLGTEHGVLLGSHQQNMLIQIEDYLPVKSWFRDCNGTAYSKEGAEKLSGQGIILDHEPAAYLFGYYVIINSTFNALSAVAHSGWCEETDLLALFRKELKKLGQNYITNYLLNHETLMHKGNFLCSFKNINENTEANPLSIYLKIKNPLFVRSSHE